MLIVHKYIPVDDALIFCLSERSDDLISNVLANINIQPVSEIEMATQDEQTQTRHFGRNFIDSVPHSSQLPLENVQPNLPVVDYKNEILQKINANQVLLISGETGVLIV